MVCTFLKDCKKNEEQVTKTRLHVVHKPDIFIIWLFIEVGLTHLRASWENLSSGNRLLRPSVVGADWWVTVT